MFSLKIAKRLTSTATSRRLLSDTAAYPQFASGQSLDKLYSQKSTNTVVDSLTSFENGNFTGYIPVKKLDISYCTSSGPGGQNVNRLYTKATVKLNLASADWIPDEVKTRIQDLHKNSINKEGEWLIRSDKTRQQTLNLADCMDKLRCYIAEAANSPKVEPSFETLEMIRVRREKAAIRRLETKKHRSVFKAQKRLDF
ncbi:PREDICTED: peptidyl-tRNA hydrolase ICT1, mitochondrial-like [Rhagoletis zephyria]|uniref:peptidyl-tRNA hydrolase ICT1, mitochondrial-like n=1 Tax=Rhagoletis zephyria TaxID=28612 RepID=UPI0008117DC8|nr:PREDICTED: peptidyl-tRNA hydrolase ICT1, mitochondrial-like [Rhagoletis zephyria]